MCFGVEKFGFFSGAIRRPVALVFQFVSEALDRLPS
jgi:hypothetical protein